MNPYYIRDIWVRHFGDVPPLGFVLRDEFPDRWLRIHSLPASQRYASNEREYGEILRRHNEVASHILSDGSECGLIVSAPCEEPDLDRVREYAPDLPVLNAIGQLPEHLWDDDDGIFACPMCLFGAEIEWSPSAYDGFIRAIADDRIEGLVFSFDTGRVYAPYDGGADLFFRDTNDRDDAKGRFRAWLSTHPAGL